MNRLLSRIVTFFLIGEFILAACGPSNTTTPTAIQQQITETVQAAAPTAIPPTNTLSPTETPLPTETPAPTESPSPTETPVLTATTPAVITPTSGPTSASSGASAHVNQATYCRDEPSNHSASIFTALAGTDLNIVSQTTVKNYVIVQNPDNPTQTCWLWTKYVTVNGDLSGLPVVSPHPTKAMDFVLNFYQEEYCTSWELSFKIVNTGPTTLQSYKIEIKDITAKVTKTTSNNFFDKGYGCSVSKDVANLVPGQAGFFHAEEFPYDPFGDEMTATVTMCSQDNQSGDCVSQEINFTP
jgi:hypothetical protein